MIKIKIKPMSVNVAWCGKRFKTPKYKAYEEEVLWMLPKLKIPNSGKSKLEIHFKIGVSSKLFDLDNFLKPFLDILQKKYLFDDKMINKLVAEKEIVKKGAEFISFEIKKYEQPDIKTRS